MKQTKKYWKGLEQLQNKSEFQQNVNKEFPEYLPISGEEGEPSRRDFLKLMGFGVAAVSLAACETPVKKAIPYIKKPASVDPTVPNFYATSFVSGSDYCSIVVKTREGRPIKIEGNKLSSVSGGGTTAQVEASVLSLYDKERLSNPLIDGKPATWEELDSAVMQDLASAGNVTIVSNSVASPSTLAAIERLTSRFGGTHVTYDQWSMSGMLSAYESAFGTRSIPYHDFSKAKTIVSFGSDFLSDWPNQTKVNSQFAATRKLNAKKQDMSRLYVFESNFSLTGANADYRIPIKPSEQGAYITALYNSLSTMTGATAVSSSMEESTLIRKAANDLMKARGESLVISSSNDVNIQLMVIAINNMLRSYGSTIDTARAINTRKGNDTQFADFVRRLNAGSVGGVVFYNCNPVYDHPLGDQIEQGLGKARFALSTSGSKDETSVLVKYQAPDHHYLESWNDFEPITGHYSLSQPTISNIFNTRQAQESFLTWAGDDTSYYDFLRANWEQNIFSQANTADFYNFGAFWEKCLHDGIYETNVALAGTTPTVNVSSAARAIVSEGSDLELVLYMKSGVGVGTQANNPWLQEMPDPITKATWDNYLTVSPKMAEEWGIEQGDMSTQTVNLTVNGKTIEVPVLPQPGQAYGTLGLAVGYGRKVAGKVANGVGVNAYPLVSVNNGALNYTATSGISVEPTGNTYRIAHTQTSQTYMGRETVVQETTLAAYQKDPQAGRSFPKIATAEGPKQPYAVTLWQGHEYPNHHWGMMIDLNSCTGCSACVVACQAENNIPTVGKDEVLNRREMLWLRIDRYYSTDATESRKDMEIAAENPEVVFQPMLCQQCNTAPCETVCPVLATTHSSEGLNQMTYNRCIGTRYCANNCPYKVRRFNWFKYHDNNKFDKNLSMNNDLGKMVLNPDVTVRARGVMEKCTFCVQRIQAGKLEARKEGRRPNDGDVTTACASACPTEAIVFGDLNNADSKVSQMLQIRKFEKGAEAREPRAYHVLEEIRTMPNIWYLTKVKNKDEASQENA